jgi:hypothetical protein
MKKKIFGSAVVVAVAALAFVTSGNSQDGNSLSLASLVKINKASAECTNDHDAGGGKCLKSQQICVGDPGNDECDFGW